MVDLQGASGAVDRIWGQKGRAREPTTQRVPLGKIHPVVTSEAMYDVARAVGADTRREPATSASSSAAPAGRAAPMKRAAPMRSAAPAGGSQRGGYPFAELAKSSRSTCVVCTAKIEKQTVRIGIERTIETPAFTGPATVWLHASCRTTCPELAELPDLDAMLATNSGGVWPPS